MPSVSHTLSRGATALRDMGEESLSASEKVGPGLRLGLRITEFLDRRPLLPSPGQAGSGPGSGAITGLRRVRRHSKIIGSRDNRTIAIRISSMCSWTKVICPSR